MSVHLLYRPAQALSVMKMVTLCVVSVIVMIEGDGEYYG